MPSFRHQSEEMHTQLHKKLCLPPEGELKNPNDEDCQPEELVFEFLYQQKIRFTVNPINGPTYMDEEHQVFTNAMAFTLRPYPYNTRASYHQSLSSMLSELRVNLAFRARIIEEVSVYVRNLMDEARSTGCRRMIVSVELTVTKVYLYEEEEALRRITRESAEEHEARGFGLVPASESAIEGLEKVKFRDGEFMSSCRICLEEMEVGMEATRLPCSHVFHGSCITSWLKRNRVCPICRFKMPV